VLRVGLTGGIGSGKSEAAGLFARLGVPVVDTDRIAHDLTRPGAPGYQPIVDAFGRDCLTAGGELDRRALRAQVFSDPGKRRRLEEILHPLIRVEIVRALADMTAPYVVIVVPLLIEAGFTDLVDRILVVDASETEQIRRTGARSGLAEEEVRRILRSQADRKSRLAAAHDVLPNDADLAALESAVRSLHAKYLELARATAD
jgi:dephospho-CoA kinase